MIFFILREPISFGADPGHGRSSTMASRTRQKDATLADQQVTPSQVVTARKRWKMRVQAARHLATNVPLQWIGGRLVSKAIAQEGRQIAGVSCPVDGGLMVILDRCGDAAVDVGATLKQVLARHEGKGGGSVVHAEGRIAQDKSEAFLKELQTALR